MKIYQIIVKESMGGTVAGAVATVESPLGSTQKRTSIAGLQPAEKVIKGKNKKKGPYANSLIEGKVKELSMDLKSGKDGLTDAEFLKKYGKTKEEMRKEMQKKPEPVKEAKLEEDDVIIVPGNISKRKTGFVPKDHSRTDHEVDMARSDLIASMKNAKSIYNLIKNRSEDEGIEGWVQEKLIKASDYLNTVKEYLDAKVQQEAMTGGVIAAGGVGEGMAKGKVSGYKMYSNHDGTWYVEDENENVVLRNASEGEAQHAVSSGNKKLKQGVAEGIENNIDSMSIEELEQFVDRILPILQQLSKQKSKTARDQFNQLKKQYDAALEKIYNVDSMNESTLQEKFKSKQQAKLMYAVAGDKDVAKKTGVSQKVAKEFIKKSHGQKVSKLPAKIK